MFIYVLISFMDVVLCEVAILIQTTKLYYNHNQN